MSSNWRILAEPQYFWKGKLTFKTKSPISPQEVDEAVGAEDAVVAVMMDRNVEDVVLLDRNIEPEKVVDDALVGPIDVLDCKVIDSSDLVDGGGPNANGGGAPYDAGVVYDAPYDASAVEMIDEELELVMAPLFSLAVDAVTGK